MINKILYKDILLLMFDNEQNKKYFFAKYGENEFLQKMLRDYLKIKHDSMPVKASLCPRIYKIRRNNFTWLKKHSRSSKRKRG